MRLLYATLILLLTLTGTRAQLGIGAPGVTCPYGYNLGDGCPQAPPNGSWQQANYFTSYAPGSGQIYTSPIPSGAISGGVLTISGVPASTAATAAWAAKATSIQVPSGLTLAAGLIVYDQNRGTNLGTIASYSGTTLTFNFPYLRVASATSTDTLVFKAIATGSETIQGAGIPPGVFVSSNGSGSGGNGTYNLTNAGGLTIGSESMTAVRRPPWNMCGIDYGCGAYATSFADPATASIPGCTYSYNGNVIDTSTGASISGTVLTIVNAPTYRILVGNSISGSGITSGTTIASFGSGSGGAGTYNLSASTTSFSGTVSIGTPQLSCSGSSFTTVSGLELGATGGHAATRINANLSGVNCPVYITNNDGANDGVSNGIINSQMINDSNSPSSIKPCLFVTNNTFNGNWLTANQGEFLNSYGFVVAKYNVVINTPGRPINWNADPASGSCLDIENNFIAGSINQGPVQRHGEMIVPALNYPGCEKVSYNVFHQPPGASNGSEAPVYSVNFGYTNYLLGQQVDHNVATTNLSCGVCSTGGSSIDGTIANGVEGYAVFTVTSVTGSPMGSGPQLTDSSGIEVLLVAHYGGPSNGVGSEWTISSTGGAAIGTCTPAPAYCAAKTWSIASPYTYNSSTGWNSATQASALLLDTNNQHLGPTYLSNNFGDWSGSKDGAMFEAGGGMTCAVPVVSTGNFDMITGNSANGFQVGAPGTGC